MSNMRSASSRTTTRRLPGAGRAAAHQVQHAAWCANDERRPGGDLLDLLADRLAAVDGHDGVVPAKGQLIAFVADLHGQLARRHQPQGVAARTLLIWLEHFQNRDGEGGRLARAPSRAWPITSMPAVPHGG